MERNTQSCMDEGTWMSLFKRRLLIVPQRPQKYQQNQTSKQGAIPEERADSLQPFSQVDRYELVQELRTSIEGDISLARHRSTGVQHIFKKYKAWDNLGKQMQRSWPREVRALEQLNEAYDHPHVMRMVFAEQLPDWRFLMCTEYCGGGDLLDQLFRFKAHGMRAPDVFLLQMMIQIGEALAFIHHGLVPNYFLGRYVEVGGDFAGGLCHVDVKAENIFLRHPLDEFGLPQLVLGDFGHATTKPRYPCGTEGFHSPELLASWGPPITTKTDVYSYAITILRVYYGIGWPLWETGRDPAELSLRDSLQCMGVESFLKACLTCHPAERLAMSVDQGMRCIAFFKQMREQIARSDKVDEAVWFGFKHEENSDEESDDDSNEESDEDVYERAECDAGDRTREDTGALVGQDSEANKTTESDPVPVAEMVAAWVYQRLLDE